VSILALEQYIAKTEFSIEDVIDRFIYSVDVKNNSKDTYRRQLKQFTDFVYKKYQDGDLSKVSRNDIVDYRNHLTQSQKTVRTVNGYITAVCNMFSWLEENETIKDISRGVKKLKPPPGFSKDCLTVSQIRQILSNFDLTTNEGLRNYALFNLMVRIGLRSVEVSTATVGDIRQKCGQAILEIQSKGCDSKDDFVILVDEVLIPLRRYLITRGQLVEQDPLFVSDSNRSRGEKLSLRMIGHIIRESFKKININDSRITPHSLRHTAISLSIANGASLTQAQAMARHSDPKTTMIYVHNQDRIKNAAERFIII